MARAQDARRTMSGGEIAVIVVVAVLVVVFAVMLAGRLTSGSDAEATPTPPAATGATGGPTSDGDATATADEDAEPVTFAMPSGNIACEIGDDSAGCVISNFTYEPADAVACPEGAGGHVRVDEAGATMPCEPLVIAGEVAILDYGESESAHGFTCESSEAGVTCRHDATGHGFALARSTYELF
ncbi:hypothetical protein [Georgenia wangjunii]|uniref:hypothetical protein n=1 Tax=Georgenia wangjunii TaxID=3117730 RepID=UPI002F2605B6